MGTTAYLQQGDVSGFSAVFWFCILHPYQGICVTPVEWVGRSCSSPQWKAVPGVGPTLVTLWGRLSPMLSNSPRSGLMGIADSAIQMKHSALIFLFSSVTSKAQPCWAAPCALAALMEGAGSCHQHRGACVMSYHSSCFEGCRAGVGEQRTHSGRRQWQKEWKWTETARGKSLSRALEECIILAKKFFLCPWQEQQRVFFYLLGHVILLAGWVGEWIQRSSEGSAGCERAETDWDRLQLQLPLWCRQSTQHTQPLCQRAPALLSLQTQHNTRRSCAEVPGLVGSVTATTALPLGED